MPIWKMIIEIVPEVTAKPDNVISKRKQIMMMKIMTTRTMMKKMMMMRMTTTSGVNNMKITMMRIMMMTRITMKMMKTITRKVAGEAEEIMEI